MSHLSFLPISRADRELLSTLMEEEVQSYRSELNWDYAPVRQILASFAKQNRLPGYIACLGNRPLGYTYFLVHQQKGIIGTLYASKPDCSQEVADEILDMAISALKEMPAIQRIESQIIPFNELDLATVFNRHEFQCYPRLYLELDLTGYESRADSSNSDERIVSWDSAFIGRAAEVVARSYQNEADALVCEDYRSVAGCESYLHSLVENPGCGFFLEKASFIGLDRRGMPCGFVVSSRISSSSAMIPQISILPSHQGRGLGRALIHQSLSNLKCMGFRSVSLTVTKKNRRALEWYQRLGFKIRKEFGAYVWQRD